VIEGPENLEITPQRLLEWDCGDITVTATQREIR
jgi:hypothetical protein